MSKPMDPAIKRAAKIIRAENGYIVRFNLPGGDQSVVVSKSIEEALTMVREYLDGE